MVDDFTSQWYHQKTKPERQQILNEIRSYLKARRLSEIDKDPELSVLRDKREKSAERLAQTEETLSDLMSELRAWDARIQELESKEYQQKVKQAQKLKEQEIISYYEHKIAAGTIDYQKIQYDQEYETMFSQEHRNRFGRDPPIDVKQAILKAARVID